MVQFPEPLATELIQAGETLMQLMWQEGALIGGHFKLSSGKHSDLYVQCARFLRRPELAAPHCMLLTTMIRVTGLKPDLVVGPAMGGIIMGYEMARQLEVPGIFTERDAEGEMSLRRGFEIKPGDQVIIAEDVVTTGRSTLEVARLLTGMGAEVLAVVSLIDRTGIGIDLPFPHFALQKVSAAVYAPAACPLCLDGVPVVKPGSRP